MSSTRFPGRGFRFKGTAEIVREGELFAKMLDFYQNRRTDTSSAKRGLAIRAFVLVKVERVLPLISPAYDDGADEKSVRTRWISHFSSLHQQAEDS